MTFPPHVEPHNGGLRFKPSNRLRALGFTRHNLEDDNGRPLTPGQAAAWVRDWLLPEIARREEAKAAPAAARRPHKPMPPVIPRGPHDFTVEDAFEAYWRDPDDFLSLRPKTQKDYKGKMAWFAKHEADLWKRQMASVHQPIAQAVYKSMRRRSHSMANGCARILRLVWSHAIRNGNAVTNPFTKMHMRATPPRVRIWTPAELHEFLKAADEHDPEMGDAILLAHDLGQRQADICKLTWKCLDANGHFQITQNKTEAKVAVPPTPELTARLAAAKLRRVAIEADLAKRRRGPRKAAPTIVLSRHHGGPLIGMNCSHRFAELREIAAKRLPSCATLNFQDLRDTCVTNLANAGCSTLLIAAITGHAPGSVETILRHYLARTTEQATMAIDMLNAYRAKTGMRPPLKLVVGGAA